MGDVSRRGALLTGAALAAATVARADGGPGRVRATPFPLKDVRLKPSIYLDAVEANRLYLHSLEPDRLLHNFRASAGLTPRGEAYGGWESRGIAGHTLGHYLSACALMHAQTGDAVSLERVRYITRELAACQAAHGDGYVAGTTVERGGKEVDGKVVLEEVRRGEIRSGGFDLNEGWVPLYTWHKVHAGLLDAHALCGDARALEVAVGACRYLAGVFDALSDAQMQRVLAAEHGGLNETFAETYARTGDRRWLATAQRIRHRKVLDPLTLRRDELSGLHANTQIPKVVGLARLHELTGDEGQATAARFFWETVTRRHSYVIGGNSEREHFGPPGALRETLTDQTCEACNTYNMLRLTRRLYGWRPDAAYFDYFERAHLNHIMAHQDPATGMFAYMTPMMAGATRRYSTPTGDFWCCVGSGMESHAKHGESIWWRDGERLVVNLYIPSRLDWRERGLTVDLETAYPAGDEIDLSIVRARAGEDVTLALRLPAWCSAPRLSVNGEPAALVRDGGYALIRRTWRTGDRLRLTLPMTLRAEALPDAPDVMAFLSGPVVLAADLGPSAAPLEGIAAALVTADPVATLKPVAGQPHVFRAADAGRPGPLTFRPFFSQYGRRTAVYVPVSGEAGWTARKAALDAEHAARAALDRRTLDLVRLGEMQPERDHDLKSTASEPINYLGRNGRVVRPGGFVEVVLQAKAGAVLRLSQWGEHATDRFAVTVDGAPLAAPELGGDRPKAFVDLDYRLPASAGGKVKVRVVPGPGVWLSLYGLRLLDGA
jgi:uncharacterized protein